MRGSKSSDLNDLEWIVGEDWPWTDNQYTLIIPLNSDNIVSIVIDPSERMADIERSNNSWINPVQTK